MTFREWHRAYVIAGFVVTALLLVRHRVPLIFLGALWEMRRDWRALAMSVVTIVQALVFLSPVVAFWPVVLAVAIAAEFRERSR